MSERLPGAIPAAARALGLAAALPISAAAFQVAANWPLGPRLTGPALYLLTTSSALVLAVMAGARLGQVAASPSADTAANWRRCSFGIVAAMLAWLGLWTGARPGLLSLLAGFATLLVDALWAAPHDERSVWFGQLRIELAAIALTCLAAAALLGPF